MATAAQVVSYRYVCTLIQHLDFNKEVYCYLSFKNLQILSGLYHNSVDCDPHHHSWDYSEPVYLSKRPAQDAVA